MSIKCKIGDVVRVYRHHLKDYYETMLSRFSHTSHMQQGCSLCGSYWHSLSNCPWRK